MTLKQTRLTCFVVLLTLVTCGCQGRVRGVFSRFSSDKTLAIPADNDHVRVHLNSQASGVRPGRVVLVASGRGNGNYQTQRKVMRELAVQFRAQGMFEVVVPDDLLLYGHSDNILQGKFDETELATVSRKYSADAVGIVRINEFRSVDPMRIGVSVAIIDSAETIQSLGAEGVWDLADNETSVAFESFLSSNASGDLHEQRIRRQAPVWLFRFSALRMVETIMRSGY